MSTTSDTPTKFLLTEDRIPTHWVNLLPDLPGEPLPPLHPGTMQPAGPPDLTPIFPMALIEQEVASSPKNAPAIASAEPHWPAPVSVTSRLTPSCLL